MSFENTLLKDHKRSKSGVPWKSGKKVTQTILVSFNVAPNGASRRDFRDLELERARKGDKSMIGTFKSS